MLRVEARQAQRAAPKLSPAQHVKVMHLHLLRNLMSSFKGATAQYLADCSPAGRAALNLHLERPCSAARGTSRRPLFCCPQERPLWSTCGTHRSGPAQVAGVQGCTRDDCELHGMASWGGSTPFAVWSALNTCLDSGIIPRLPMRPTQVPGSAEAVQEQRLQAYQQPCSTGEFLQQHPLLQVLCKLTHLCQAEAVQHTLTTWTCSS